METDFAINTTVYVTVYNVYEQCEPYHPMVDTVSRLTTLKVVCLLWLVSVVYIIIINLPPQIRQVQRPIVITFYLHCVHDTNMRA